MTLTEFLLARVAEDEAAAQSALALYGSGTYYPNGHPLDPARALAECEAKRRIVALGPTPCPMREPAYDGDDDLGDRHHYPDKGWASVPHYEACDSCKESAASDYVWRVALRTLAAVYRDHEDWRGEWA